MMNVKDLEKKKKENEYYGFIYITTNNINGKQYIGKKKYCGNYQKYLGSGIALQNAINKYGVENFNKQIIQECLTKLELNGAEQYWIKFYNAVESDNYYNITYGGDGGFGSGKNSPWYGKHLSQETKQILSNLRSGKNNPFFNKKHSDESLTKMSISSTGRLHTEECKKKMSQSMKINHADFSGCNNPNSKAVKQFDKNDTFIKLWDCAKTASNELNINYSSLTSCCAGKYKTAGGFKWQYA